MCCEDRRDIDVPLPTERNGDASLPFVKMCNNGSSELPGEILNAAGEKSQQGLGNEGEEMHLAEEPCYDVAKDNAFVGFVVARWCRDACEVPEIAFPLIEAVILAACIEEEDVGITVDEPATVEAFYALYTHGFEGSGDVRVSRLLRLDFHGGRFVRERADEGVSVTKLGYGDGHL